MVQPEAQSTREEKASVVRRFIALCVLTAAIFAGAVATHAAEMSTFTTEQEAQRHCPSDVVVWLNLPSGIYHFKGQRWYGATKNGAFVCKEEADRAGDRATRNGE
jgi:hypothetical protein